MISKLPRWVLLGSSILAFIAGMINAVGFMSFQKQGVTHLTGSTTLVGIAAAEGDSLTLLHLAGIVLFFILGAVFGGFIIREGRLRLSRRYGAALLLESALLFLAVPLLDHQLALGAYLASCACGLQNGMASTYSGAVVRTTHLTGAVTDLGISIGHWLRRLPIDRRRVLLNTLLISSFLSGALAGGFGFKHLQYHLLYLPASVTGGVGLLYLFLTARRRGRPSA